jgi:hypothetical protein
MTENTPKKKRKPPQLDYMIAPEECDRIYTVLGGNPDLDPCGHPDQFIKAKDTCYGMSEADDGFQRVWQDSGTVFLNPPHGEREPNWDAILEDNPEWVKPDWPWYSFSKWITKASVTGQSGGTVLAFMPASTDRKWFHQYAREAQAIVFLEKRVKSFIPAPRMGDDPVKGAQPMNAHMFVLWTSDKEVADRFYETYRNLGMVVEPRPIQ